MANKNLASAKKAKNDEFYTQYRDIQKEVEAYLEYDPSVFRGKVVYCNCDDPFESNFFRYFVLNFKRLGLKRLITTSYKPSPVANTQLGLFGDDVSIPFLKGRPKITANRFFINNVGDINGDGSFTLQDIAEQLKKNKHNEWAPLIGDGDFRSNECIELLKQSDVVVTNPPFSLFREYLNQLMEYNKLFLIVGNMNAITYKEVFPLIQNNRVWLGNKTSSQQMFLAAPQEYTEKVMASKPQGMWWRVIDGQPLIGIHTALWFTNLEHGRRHQALSLMTLEENLKFNQKMKGKTSYDRYDNYDAIDVPFTNAIPSNYDGVMGVPISFLDKYSPEQFEIIGMSKTPIGTHLRIKEYPRQVQVDKHGKKSYVTKLNDGAAIEVLTPPNGGTYYEVNGKKYTAVYPRVLIRHLQKKKA